MDSSLVTEIKHHLDQMAPHVSERKTAQLLKAALKEIEAQKPETLLEVVTESRGT